MIRFHWPSGQSLIHRKPLHLRCPCRLNRDWVCSLWWSCRRIQIGKDRIEETGNNRKDTIAANFLVTTGGNAEHKVQGRHQIEAGQAIERKTRIYQLQAGDKAEIIDPAGKITLDGEGVTIEGVRIKLMGPVQTETGWVKNALDVRSDVNKGDPFTPEYFPFSG
ncbi:hypothetical protein HR51_08685 [Burkholderia cepacia]|nr:hypothetical protein HR51_08685 [Burkholderia cepacia]